jgi:PEGA domain
MMARSDTRVMLTLARLATALVVLGVWTGRGRAQDPEALIREGNELRRAGQNEKALPLFQRAYEISATPRTAGQLGLAEFATERYVEADSHLVEGLRGRNDPWVSKYRATLEQALTTIRSRVAHVEIAGSPEGAEVIVNGRMVGRLPRTPTVAVNPGRVEIQVGLSGHEPLREVRELLPGTHEQVDIRLRRMTPMLVDKREPSGPPPPTTVGWLRPAGIAVGAAGVLVMGTGVALRVVANSKRDRIDEDARAGRPYDPANGNWQSYGRASTTCLVAGGVASVGGSILWFVGRPAATSVSLAPTTEGMHVVLKGTF